MFQPVPARRSELTVARRAMACEFSVVLPFGIRYGVDAACAALDTVERLESKLSIYRGDSDLSYVNRRAAEERVRVDAEVYSVLQAAARLSRDTGGAFDAASGALVSAWGFFRGPKRVPADDEVAAAREVSGMSHVSLEDEPRTVAFDRRGVVLNLGGIGKGYALDRAFSGIRNGLMQGGQSSLLAHGAPAGCDRGWAVDIGSPAIARVWLRDRALGTSGADNQFFEYQGCRYGHILDPRTGRPAIGMSTVSVIAPTAAEADALSTAFFVLGVEGARRYCRSRPDIAAILLPSGQVRPTVIGKADVEVLM
jgi:thiamine biosynthesis lipoprotein